MSLEKNISLLEKHGTFKRPELEVGQDGDLSRIDSSFLELYLGFRDWHRYPSLVTSAYRKTDSAHGKGGVCRAFDSILFRKYLYEPLSPYEIWLHATTFPFWGVGIYFDWQYTRPDGTRHRTPGIHTDSQKSGSRPLRWAGLPSSTLVDQYPGLRIPKWSKYQYFYQSPSDGVFYNSVLDINYRLEEMIGLYWESL